MIHFLFKAELSRFTACLPKNASCTAQIKYATMPAVRGKKRMLAVIAPMKLSCPVRMKARVRPQAGHGKPVKSLKRQGMEKGVWIVRIKINTPIAYADKIIIA